ncbi:MAG: alkaline phosphatase PhoX [Pseudomonadota bacterium]
MKTCKTDRRQFLAWGSLSFAAFLLAGVRKPLLATESQTLPLFANPAALGELGAPDANGLQLLPGFRSRVIARSGQVVLPESEYRWHNSPDGGATFATPDGGWIYVSNSEVQIAEGGGGVGAVRFNAAGEATAAYSILSGTDNNCAGGKTPWQTWLSCEEVDCGLVWECDPFGVKPGVALPALGRFKHEAVAVDPVNSHLYLTEDETDGGFYRFIPANALPDLSAGTLQIAEVVAKGATRHIVWHDVPDPAAKTVRTRLQVPAASHFNGGEGIAWTEGLVYFTTKGDNRVWRFDIHTNQIDVIYDFASATTPHLSGVDNVTITASGDVLVAEDGGDMQIVLLGPNRLVLPVVKITGQDTSEICGPAFDPTFQYLYFSSQTGPSNRPDGGILYEISYDQ